VLEKRLRKYDIESTIIDDDCNIAVNEILENLSNNDHYLAFIDCESGLELHWDTLMSLLSKQGDLIFNFQTSNVYRAVSQWQKNKSLEPRRLMNFYGDESWKLYDSQADCLNGFIQKIQSETNRDIVIPLHVRGIPGYSYDLLVATKETRGGSPWMQPILDLQDTYRKLEPKIVQTVVDVIHGRKKTLFDYN
jgi:hypothetical protein